MDTQDTNLPLEEGKLEEEKNVPEVSEVVTEETPEETTEVNMSAAANLQSKQEVIERLKELSANAESTHKQELDSLKQTFYKLHKIEQESAKKKFIEEGGTEESFVPAADNDEAEFKSIMTAIKEKRSTFNAELEKQKEENLQTKLGIIEKLKELVNYPEDVNKAYNDFKKLQQEWNEIKLVPQAKVNELWKNYQVYVEKFYDIIKINNEFRDYDFKKNLEIKTKLCEAAERLANEADVVSAFHQLQKLHQEFRDTGPVAKELRDEIWARFKNASTEVNRRHQQHFEALKEVEQRNLDEKNCYLRNR